MKYDFVVLGGTGLQGRIVARDLVENKYSVLLCGRNRNRIEHVLKRYKNTGFRYLDLRDVGYTAKVIKESGANVVVNCAEEDWDLNALKACVKAGAHNIDLGSEIPMTREQFKMNNLLKSKALTHITGCGSVPGIGNVMLRYAADKLDTIKNIDVGYAWTSNIKKFVVPFSIPTILNEFKSPATNLEKGKVMRIIPISTIKDYYDEYVGEEKLFSVRHPETYTFYHYFKDKGLETIRFYAEFPPHSFQKIMDIIELGLDSDEWKTVNGVKVRPIDFMNEALKDIKTPKGYTEKEDLWLTIIGRSKGKKKIIKMNCVAPTLKGWEDAGCNIDTGMPASIMAQMVKKEIIKERGVFAPEAIVPPEPFFEELRKRKMIVYENGKAIN